MLAVEPFAHGLDGHFLVMAVGNVALHAKVADILAAPLLNQEFQVALGMERIEPPRRVAKTVDNVRLVTVGVIDYRAAAILLFEAVRIKFRLVLALYWRNRRLFRLDYSQREPVRTKKHVIGKTDTLPVRHPFHFDFDTRLRRLHDPLGRKHSPPCLAEHAVNQDPAGFRLGLGRSIDVVRFSHRFQYK